MKQYTLYRYNQIVRYFYSTKARDKTYGYGLIRHFTS